MLSFMLQKFHKSNNHALTIFGRFFIKVNFSNSMGSINYLSTFRAPASSNVPTTCSGFFLIIRYSMNPYLPYCSSSFMPFWIIRFTSFNDIICYWSICFSKFNHSSISLFTFYLSIALTFSKRRAHTSSVTADWIISHCTPNRWSIFIFNWSIFCSILHVLVFSIL